MLAGAARAPDAVTARWPCTRRRGQCGLADSLGVARPVGTPRGSNDGCVGQGGAEGFSPETTSGGGVEKMVCRGSRALVAGEGVDEFLLLQEGTGEVRRGPKGADKGGMRELTEGERNGGAAVTVWSVGVDTRPRREGKGLTGCSGVLMREDERGNKGGGGRRQRGTLYKRGTETGEGPRHSNGRRI
jgi:hypothetical protein